MRTRSPLSILTFCLVAAASMPGAASWAASDQDETATEQAAARAAEASPHHRSAPRSRALPKAIQLQLQYPLLAGVDDTAIPAYRIDPLDGSTTEAFVGAPVWGAAYDILQDTVYFNAGALLYRWPVGGAIEELGTITDGMAVDQTMVALAFVNGRLYATRNIANEAVYQIDPVTRVATVAIDYADAEYDFGGLAADPRTGLLYGTNDTVAPHGAGVFRINTDGSATLVAAYPVGQTDIDGLAIDDSGLAYLVTDEPGSIYVLDLDTGSYLDPIPNPWTTSETFSGATWIGQSPALCNFNPIAIPSSGTGSLYPSTITVEGQGGAIERLRVHLLGMSHTWPDDIDILLVGPQGENLVLMSDAGSSVDLANIDLSFDDEAAEALPDATEILAGTYRPTDHEGGDAFPPPAPAGSGATQLATFAGSDPNGVWTLYVRDDTGGDSGQIAQGWCLDILAAHPQLSSSPGELHQFQAADQISQLILTLSNTGSADLSWSLQESAPALLKAGPARPARAATVGSDVQGMPAGGSLSDRAQDARAPIATTEAKQPFSIAGVVGGGPIFYGERSLFDTAFPGLPLEDFEDGLWADGGVLSCPAPFDATTDNACFAPGGILPGIRFRDDPLNDAGGGSPQGLAGLGSGFAGSDSKSLVSNTYVDSFNVDFAPPVHAVGADLVHFAGRRQTVEISLFDAADQLIATTQALAGNTGNFWGVYSPQPIRRINLFSLASGFDGAEGVDDLAFGSLPDECTALVDIPWLDLDLDFGLMPPGGNLDIQARFDSTGLALGTYSANLCVSSNDPLRPRFAVPVSLTVQGDAIFRDGFED